MKNFVNINVKVNFRKNDDGGVFAEFENGDSILVVNKNETGPVGIPDEIFDAALKWKADPTSLGFIIKDKRGRDWSVFRDSENEWRLNSIDSGYEYYLMPDRTLDNFANSGAGKNFERSEIERAREWANSHN